MKRAALYSAILHAIVFLILMLDVPNPFKKTLSEQKPFMMEFETVSDVSMAPVLAPQSAEEPEPQPQPEPEPEPQPVPEPQPEPTPETPQESSEPEAESEPEPEVEPELEPEAPVLPMEQPKKDPPKEEKPKPEKPVVEKPKEKPKKEKALLDLEKKKPSTKSENVDKKKLDKDFDSLINDLEKADKKNNKKSSSFIKGAPADKVGPVLTGTEVDAIRAHIAKFWLVPAGIAGGKDIVVVLRLKIGRDRQVLSATIQDMTRYKTDPVFRAVADSAKQAVLDPNCSPLPLNPDKYEEWKEIDLPFNPRNMY